MTDDGVSRRRVPRRAFEALVGVLRGGEYSLERAYQVGEGGLLISSQKELEIGRQIVVSFQFHSVTIIVRGVVRNHSAVKDGGEARYGLEFVNLGFQSKRAIRNFVAGATNLQEEFE